MRALALVWCLLLVAPAAEAAKKKKPAAAKKAPAPKPEPEAPPPPPAKKLTVLLDTNPAALAYQLEQALQEKYVVGITDPALPEEIGHEAVVKAAKKGGAVAVVTARYANGTWVVRTYSGADGGVLAEVTFRGPTQGKVAIPKPGMAKLLAAAAKAETASASDEPEAAAATPAKTPAKGTDAGKDKKPSGDDKKKAAAKEPEPAPVPEKIEAARATADDEGEPVQALRLGAGVRLGDRKLVYTDDLFGALSRYSSPLAPSIAIEAELFPGAFATRGLAAIFGLVAAVDFLVGVTAVAADGSRFPTSAVRLKASLAGRIPLGRLEVGILFGYALTTYAISGDPTLKPNVPDVGYSALRPGLTLSLKVFGPVYVRATGGYQILLAKGQLGAAEYFPRSTGGGLDFQAGVSVKPLRFVELRATFDYQRFWFSMNPEPGDPYIAGGALDDSRGFSVLAAFTY